MFGPRLTTVFASRWRAIWFAASVCLFAYCSVPQQSADAPDGDDAALAAALGDSPFAPDANTVAKDSPDMADVTNSEDMKRLEALVGKLQDQK